MEIGHWIVLGIWLIGQLTALVITYLNLRLKLKELEMTIKNTDKTIKDNQHSFHIHEQQNEKMFDKFEKKMDDVYNVVHEVKNILINQK